MLPTSITCGHLWVVCISLFLFLWGKVKILSQTFMCSIKIHPEEWVLIEDSSLFLLWIPHFETDDLKLFEIYWLDAISVEFISLWSWTNMSCRTKTKGMDFLETAVDQEFNYFFGYWQQKRNTSEVLWSSKLTEEKSWVLLWYCSQKVSV